MKWKARRALGPAYAAGRRLWHAAKPQAPASRKRAIADPAESREFFQQLEADVLHFPYQHFVRCAIPTIFNPHDLQHLHYPQFFSREQIERREAIYRAGCEHSHAVVADSRWVKGDIVQRYGIAPEKVHVIWPGPATELCEEPDNKALARIRRELRLPDAFALYPAQTWPHKNHLRLLEALALLKRNEGSALALICTGRKNEHWPRIRQRARELHLAGAVRFVGFVAPSQMRALYRLARFVIFPSLFEGAGLPVIEAFAEGAPVACSQVTSLAEYGGDAVLLFDPTSVESIAEAMRRMTLDSELRTALRERGAERARLFSWHRAALAYRALYRKVAGRALTEQDEALLKEASA